MVNTAEIRALLVTPDPWLVSNFISLCRELGIAVQRSATLEGVPEELGQAKYEAVLVDFDTVPATPTILAGVRESRGNRNALVFAVATDTALRDHSMARKLDACSMRHTISWQGRAGVTSGAASNSLHCSVQPMPEPT